MANRVTTAEVEEIIDTDLTDGRITVCIDTAHNLVETQCVGNDLSDDTLKSIERWLSAHFVAVVEPRITREKADVVGASYMHKVDLYLASTVWGQQAMLLDTSGNLSELNDGIKNGSLSPNFTFKSINVMN